MPLRADVMRTLVGEKPTPPGPNTFTTREYAEASGLGIAQARTRLSALAKNDVVKRIRMKYPDGNIRPAWMYCSGK